jgi:hypothetical protein
MRSHWLGQLYDLAEETLSTRLKSLSEVEKWYADLTSRLRRLDMLSRILAPIPGRLSYDMFFLSFSDYSY